MLLTKQIVDAAFPDILSSNSGKALLRDMLRSDEYIRIEEDARRRGPDLDDWEILTSEGKPELPLADEHFQMMWMYDFVSNQVALEAGANVVDAKECPIKVTGWKSWGVAMDWMRSESKTRGLYPDFSGRGTKLLIESGHIIETTELSPPISRTNECVAV